MIVSRNNKLVLHSEDPMSIALYTAFTLLIASVFFVRQNRLVPNNAQKVTNYRSGLLLTNYEHDGQKVQELSMHTYGMSLLCS